MGLKVGTMSPSAALTVVGGAFIPIHSQPLESIDNRQQGFFYVSTRVSVVNAQQELPAVLPGVEPVEQRGPHAADVQIAGGTRSEAGANGHVGVPASAGGMEKGNYY